MTSVLCTETDARVGDLRKRLDDFYRTTTVYDAFKGVNTSPMFWKPILEEIRARVEKLPTGAKLRVLEFGAGRTGFGDALGDLRSRVELHIQDVTPQNVEFLQTQGDKVHVGDVFELPGPYDIIFSTFVWEHLDKPQSTLAHLLKTLGAGGSVYIASPRYDLPVYLPPSARHYGFVSRVGVMFRLIGSRARAMAGGKPAFLIHVDPALFHKPWYRDADAIHWPSIHDLKRSVPKGYRLESIGVDSGNSLRGLIWSKFLLLFVRISREGGGPGAA